jgi:hypothetical protein
MTDQRMRVLGLMVLLALTGCQSPPPPVHFGAMANVLAAQAPASPVTAFDGTYVGVSRTSEGPMSASATRACAPNGQPGPRTIAGGVVRWPGTVPAAGGTAEGSVNAQGVLVMHGPLGMRFDGQIDVRGTVTGRLTSFCGYQLVWQKEGK